MSQIPTTISELISTKKDLDTEQKIVNELLNQENLDSKTELGQPIKFVLLKVIHDLLEDNQLKESSIVLERFINLSFRYLISKDRKGRLEYIEALKSVRENQKTVEPNAISMKV